MAIKGAVRWKPDAYRSSIEATVIDLNPTGQYNDAEGNPLPPTGVPGGTIILVAQAVAYDDAKVGGAGNPYRPGHPDTEREIVVLHEQTRQYDLSAVQTMTQAQVNSFLNSELIAYKNWVLPAGTSLVKTFYSARMAPPVLVE
jgi:hypothetical protein